MHDTLILLIAFIVCVGAGIAGAIVHTTQPKQHTCLIWACTDCYFSHHGYDEHELGYEFETEPLCLVDDDTEVTAGMLIDEHDEYCPNRIAGTWVDECECEHITFSWSWCRGCGSTLGGDRYALTLWWWTPAKPVLPTRRRSALGLRGGWDAIRGKIAA